MHYAAVDYVRLTWRRASLKEDRFTNLWPRLHAVAQTVSDGELVTEPARVLGYFGNRAGPVFLGRSDQGGLLQASGFSAQLVCELGLCPDGVPRLDAQVTIWYDQYDSDVARRAAQEAGEAAAGRRGRKPARRLVTGYGAGDTCYLGTRGKKSVFIRVYDKQKESGDAVWTNAWRYEAELSDDYAVRAYWEMMEARFGETMVRRMVIGYLRMRGLELSVEDGECGFDAASIPKEESSTSRRLRWLGDQVAPAIARLIADGVPLAEILSAIGMSPEKGAVGREDGYRPRESDGDARRRPVTVSGLGDGE